MCMLQWLCVYCSGYVYIIPIFQAHLEDESVLMFSIFDDDEEDLQPGGEEEDLDVEEEQVTG